MGRSLMGQLLWFLLVAALAAPAMAQPPPAAEALAARSPRCDDRSDDTAAIQAALDAGASRVVQLPGGRCRITSMLTIRGHGTRLVGAGMGVTFLQVEFEHDARNPASVLFTASDPAQGFIAQAGLQGISIQSRRAAPGIGLKVVMPNGFHWRDSQVLGHAVGVEIVGGYNVYADATHINAAPHRGGPGTRYLVLSGQRRADGSLFSPQGVHATNFNWSGDNHVEHGVEVRAADGVYLANGYIGEARECQLLVAASPEDKFVSTVNLTGVYLDGNFRSACGAALTGRAVDIKLTGANVANFTGPCLRLEGDEVLAVTVTGGVLMRCRTAIAAQGGAGLVVSGVTLFSTGPIRLGAALLGPVAITGNSFVRPSGNDAPIVVEADRGQAPLRAAVSIFGNAFGREGGPLRLEVPAPNLRAEQNAPR